MGCLNRPLHQPQNAPRSRCVSGDESLSAMRSDKPPHVQSCPPLAGKNVLNGSSIADN